ncbi:uncharacterized protein LOC144101433 [Amblyomma americanum]
MKPSLVFLSSHQADICEGMTVVGCHCGLLSSADKAIMFVIRRLYQASYGDEDSHQGILGEFLSRADTRPPETDASDVTEGQQSPTELTNHHASFSGPSMEHQQQLIGDHQRGTPRCCLGSSAGAAFPTGAVTSAEAALPLRCLPAVRELRIGLRRRLLGSTLQATWGLGLARGVAWDGSLRGKIGRLLL